MNSVLSFLNDLNITPKLRKNQKYSDGYIRVLQKVLKKNYNVTVCWDNDLFTLNANRQQTDFKKFPELAHCFGITLTIPESPSEFPIIVAYSFPIISETVPESLDNFRVEPMIDGTIIKVFNYNSDWCVSTVKRPDAANAYWNNRNFRVLFDEAAANINLNITELDPEFCYTFVLTHPDNSSIVNYTTASVTLISVYNIHANKVVDLSHLSDNELLSSIIPEDLTNKFNNSLKACVDSLPQVPQNKISSPITPDSTIGYILINKETNERHLLESPLFKYASKLKGNIPNTTYHVLYLIKKSSFDQNSNLKNNYLTLFPKNTQLWEQLYETVTKALVDRIYNNFYTTGTSESVFASIIPMEQWIINDLCFRSIENENPSLITKEFITDYVKSLSTFRLAVMLDIPYVPRINNMKPNYHDLSQYYAKPFGNNINYNKKIE